MKKLNALESADDDEEVNIEALLRPYLQRLEIFLTAPEKDEVGKRVLKGKDLVGPKVVQINKIIKDHFTKKIPGKILVFTSYHKSADSIYENLSPELKAKAIRYHAGNSDADLAQFERDPNIQILIGTENTLNTGHNLQMASRIIRVESVWTPGNLDQSMARVYRPDPKNLSGVDRQNIYLDWVIVNYTIDITKISRLISKILVKVQFDEYDNSAYNDLESLPVVSMTLESIMDANDFSTTLAPYAEAYSEYLEVVRKDLEEYRNDPKNKLVYTPISRDPKGVKGQAIMEVLPYNPDPTLPKEIVAAGNLVRMSDYATEHGAEDEGVKDFDATGLLVHTERGEGKVLRSSASTVRVEFKNGDKHILDKLSVFVIQSKKLPNPPIRKQLADLEGQPLVNPFASAKVERKLAEVKTKVPTTAPIVKVTKKDQEQNQEKIAPVAGAVIPLEIYSIYDMLAIDLEDVDELSKKQLAALEAFGFRSGGKYMICEIPNLRAYDRFLAKMEETYDVSKAHMKVLTDLRQAFTGGKERLFTAHRALSTEMRNFWRVQSKPAGKNELRPYPVVWEGDLHIAVRLFQQPAARTVKTNLRVPGVTWDLIEDDYMLFCQDKADVVAKIAKLNKLGFTIKRPKAFQKSLDAIRMLKKTQK